MSDSRTENTERVPSRRGKTNPRMPQKPKRRGYGVVRSSTGHAKLQHEDGDDEPGCRNDGSEGLDRAREAGALVLAQHLADHLASNAERIPHHEDTHGGDAIRLDLGRGADERHDGGRVDAKIADTAQASRNVNQNPWPDARRCTASSPAPSRLPHTAETPWPSELPRAMLTISKVMTTLMQAKPTDPMPLPTTMPSETTMAIWAITPTSEMAA